MIFKLDKLLDKRNVIGFSEESDRVEVYLSKKYDDSTAKRLISTQSVNFWEKDLVPGSVRRWFKKKPTKIIEIEEVETHSDRKTYRPLKGGCEIGIKDSRYVGTGGGLVKRHKYRGITLTGKWESFKRLLDKYGISYDTEEFLVTNTHVALSDVENHSTEIYVQPLRGSKIGEGCEASEFSLDGANYVDASIIPPSVELSSEQIPGYELEGFNFNLTIGDYLKKYGRTTEFTEGEVENVGAAILVNHHGKRYLFKDVIKASRMSAGGDSGSMVFDKDNNCVGLIFAGNNNVSFIIPIKSIIKKFGLATKY